MWEARGRAHGCHCRHLWYKAGHGGHCQSMWWWLTCPNLALQARSNDTRVLLSLLRVDISSNFKHQKFPTMPKKTENHRKESLPLFYYFIVFEIRSHCVAMRSSSLLFFILYLPNSGIPDRGSQSALRNQVLDTLPRARWEEKKIDLQFWCSYF